jgi:hypothetical protein
MMRIERRYTTTSQDAYADLAFRAATSEIRNPDGSVVFRLENIEVPQAWSQVAADVLAQKYFRKAGVPMRLRKVEETGIPSWLWRSVPDEAALAALPEAERYGSEMTARQVFDRLAGCWTYWGWKGHYFDSEEDAHAFYDELCFMLCDQMVAPNSPQWFNTGLHWAYGITGPSGLMNQTGGELYAPIFLSRPFFLYTSSDVTSVFDVLPDTPDESRHGSFIGVEPITGKVLDFAFRMQVNALVKPVTVKPPFENPFTYFSNVAGGYYPICWGQQRAMVTGDQNDDFTGSLYTGLRILAAIRWASITLLLVCFLAAAYFKWVIQPSFAKVEREEEVRFEASNLLMVESSNRLN